MDAKQLKLHWHFGGWSTSLCFYKYIANDGQCDGREEMLGSYMIRVLRYAVLPVSDGENLKMGIRMGKLIAHRCSII